MEERTAEDYERMEKEAIYAELKAITYHKSLQNGQYEPGIAYAFAELSEPIQNKNELMNTTVSPFFRHLIFDNRRIFLIDIEFSDLGRRIVLRADYSPHSITAFLKAAKSSRSFLITDGPHLVTEPIQIPILKPDILDDILNSFDYMNDPTVLKAIKETLAAPKWEPSTMDGTIPRDSKQKRWWEFWKRSPTNKPSDGPSEKKRLTGRMKKCRNCGITFPLDGLQCSVCGSHRFTWE